MEWVVICALFGIVTMVAAKSRGRSSSWFLAGLLLGPIGLIWLLVIPANEEAVAAARIHAGVLKLCPYCAETIQPDAKLCKHCGKDQPETISDDSRISWTCECTYVTRANRNECWRCRAPKPANVKLFDAS